MRYFLDSPVWLISLMCLSCGGNDKNVREALRPVRFVQVYASGGTRVRTFSGAARSGVESNLSFKVTGTIEAVQVKVGDRVRKGQLLVRLDAKDYQLQVQQASAALSQARAQEQKAKADYDRIRGLYENNNAAKSDLDAARASFDSATAAAQAADKQLELARLQVSYTRLTAPSAGSIASVHVEVNENVAPGRIVLLLTAGSQIEVEVAMPEILISQIKKGATVSVKFDALPGKSHPAVVTEVGVASTGFATTFPVTVQLQSKDDGIRSGMAAEVSFSFESSGNKERFIVPSVALGEDRQGRFVFVVKPAGGDTAIVVRQKIEIGDLTTDGFEVFTGLNDGDLVVTAGVSKIRDGQRVKFQAVGEKKQ